MLIPTLVTEGASLFASGAVILGALWTAFKFFHRQQMQDHDLEMLRVQHNDDIRIIRKEQQMLCYGVLACLEGLQQKGCDGNVTKAHEALEKHLNDAAHDS